MKITINGNVEQYSEPDLSVYDLLQKNEVKSVDTVSVQLNGQFIKKDEFSTIKVKENDTIDFLYFMGGGGR